MKKNKLLILSLAVLSSFSFVGCSETSSQVSSSSNDTISTSSSSSSSFVKETSWNENIKKVMNDTIDCELPFISLDEYSYETYKNDTNIDELNIYELNSGESKIEEIRTLLMNDGYEIKSKDTSLGYDQYITSKTDEDENGVTYVIYGFIDSKVENVTHHGNFLRAYHIYMVDGFSSEEKALINEKIGTDIPYLPFTNAHTLEYSEKYDYILMKDENLDGDTMLYSYMALLSNAGYSLHMTSDFQEYFTITHPTMPDKEIVIVVIDMRYYSYSSGVAYQVYVDMNMNEVTSMPYDQMKEYFGSDFNTSNIPSFTNFTSLAYGKNSSKDKEDGYFFIEATLPVEDIYAYVTALKNLEYEINYSSTYSRYVAYSFDETVRIDYIYTIESGATSGTFQMKVTLMTPTYTSITKEFPSSTVGSSYPSFSASQYKVFDTTSNVTIKTTDKDNTLVSSYRTTLKDAGFSVKFNNTNGHYEATKDNYKVEFYLSGTTFIAIYNK
jgi:hypothetical protein